MDAEELLEELQKIDYFTGFPDGAAARALEHLRQVPPEEEHPALALAVWVDPREWQAEGACSAQLQSFVAGSWGALAGLEVEEGRGEGAVQLRVQQDTHRFEATIRAADGPVPSELLALLAEVFARSRSGGEILQVHSPALGWGQEGACLIGSIAAPADPEGLARAQAPSQQTPRGKWIDIAEDWAYWINPVTFRMPRIKGGAPPGVIVVIKRREDFVVTEHFETSEEGLEARSKKEASERLAAQMYAFMDDHSMFPPGVSIKRVYKNGNVDLAYAPSSYDSFTLRVSPGLVGGPVEAFLDSLQPFRENQLPSTGAPATPAPRTAPGVGPDWRIEPARSGRARCRSCGEKIAKGALRLGQPDWFEDRKSFRWHHLACQTVADPSELEGFAQLSDEHKREALSA